jgi:metallophosphoesterase (TIGR00282 family)
MRLLYLGDIMGRAGRTAVISEIAKIRLTLNLDFVVACGENAAHGFGITIDICHKLFDSGVDVITTGNHAWDQREIIDFIKLENRLLRPMNYADDAPGNGSGMFFTRGGHRVAVCQVMGQLFMQPVDDPFKAIDKFLMSTQLSKDADAIIIDVHGEATSEKAAIAWLADGRASLVVGSHSHVPTADARILSAGTGFQTDAGMCGPYDSVIGMDKGIALRRFVDSVPGERLEPASGPATICGVFLETDSETGLAKQIKPIRIGGDLLPSGF